MPGPNLGYEGFIVAALPLEGPTPGKYYATEIHRESGARIFDNERQYLDLKQRFEGLLTGNGNISRIPLIVIGMPHVVRTYHAGNPLISTEQETNFHGSLFDSQTLERKASRTPEDPVVGCDAEVAILGIERLFWNGASTVEAYLDRFAPTGSLGKVKNANKLWEFLETK
jgi:hypothetical protein